MATPVMDYDAYRLLVQEVKDYAIFMLDPKGTILSWNAAAQRLKGYSPQEIIGKHFSIFYEKQDVVNRKPQRELETASTEGRVEDEGWRLRKRRYPHLSERSHKMKPILARCLYMP